MMNETELLFIDIEASGLYHNSYPIEIAWSLPGGNIESHLINPETIPDWQTWDAQAEEIHGISRDRLILEGKDPRWLAKHMDKQLSGKILYSDNPRFDMEWVKELFFVCGKMPVHFHIESVITLFEKRFSSKGLRFSQARDMAIARSDSKAAHRAANDVSNLQLIWQLAREADT